MLFRDRWWVVVAGILLLAVLNELEVVQIYGAPTFAGKTLYSINKYNHDHDHPERHVPASLTSQDLPGSQPTAAVDTTMQGGSDGILNYFWELDSKAVGQGRDNETVIDTTTAEAPRISKSSVRASPVETLKGVVALGETKGWTEGLCCTNVHMYTDATAPLTGETFMDGNGEWVHTAISGANERLCQFMLPKSTLLFNPPDMEGQLQPCLHSDVWRTSSFRADNGGLVTMATKPVFSIIVNVFNHGFSIARVITQVLKLTTEPFELILFFDGCTDDSVEQGLAVVNRYLKNAWPVCSKDVEVGEMSSENDVGDECVYTPPPHSAQQGGSSAGGGLLVHFRAIVQAANNSVYETTGNNIAMRSVAGKFIVLMQDDMYLLQRGWNSRLAAGPRTWDDVVSVSAMCAHDLYDHRGNPNHKTGPCGARRRMMQPEKATTAAAAASPAGIVLTIDNAYAGEKLVLKMEIRQTSNRGPLLIVADKAKQLQYLDEYNYRLAKDDHDFHCRAFLEKGWYTGHISIGFCTNLAEGGVRLGRKTARPQYDLIFTKRRNGRKNRQDCLVSKRAEYDAKVNATGGAALESRVAILNYKLF